LKKRDNPTVRGKEQIRQDQQDLQDAEKPVGHPELIQPRPAVTECNLDSSPLST